jgi:O-methyltransferase
MIFKALNFIAGKIFNKNGYYITGSLNYLKRKRSVDRNYMDYVRLSTLELAVQQIKEAGLSGAVAELGVYKGKFARYINQYFPDRTLYLFDTFEGFEKRDIKKEVENNYSTGEQNFSDTSVEKVLGLMPHPDRCVVKKGYFPETAEGVNDSFVFVSIDTDLYDPIYNGLRYFYPRLSKGGYIFVHDYNNDGYIGAKEAVDKFCAENEITKLVIPDVCGTAIIVK